MTSQGLYLDINCYGNKYMTSLVQEHGKQCMPYSANFPVTLQTEVLSTETSDFLKQIIVLGHVKGEGFPQPNTSRDSGG